MGRKKTYVNAVTARLMEDDDFTPSTKYATNKYITTQRQELKPNLSLSFSDFLLEATQNTLPTKLRKVYQLAKNKDRFIFGLPTVSYSSELNKDYYAAAQVYLENLKQEPITVISQFVNTKNHYHEAWQVLITSYGYNSLTNELEALTPLYGSPCYLKEGQLYLTQDTIDDLREEINFTQNGLPMNFGKCFEREEDITRGQPEPIVGLSDELVFTFSYEEPIPDIEPPAPIVVNILNETGLSGYAEYDSTVEVTLSDGTVHSVICSESGYFRLSGLDIPLSSSVTLRSLDSSNNASEELVLVVPYENEFPVNEGSQPSKNTQIVDDTKIIDLSYLNPVITDDDDVPSDSKYLQMMYSTSQGYSIFTYMLDSGLIPEIDNAGQYSDQAVGRYFPRIYTRKDAKDLIDVPNTSQYKKASERAFKKLSLNLKDMTTTVNKAIGEVNGDFKFVFIHMTVSVNKDTEDNATAKYLFNYFDGLYDRTKVISGTQRGGLNYKVKDSEYTQEIEYSKINKEQKPGIAKDKLNAPLKVGSYCVIFGSVLQTIKIMGKDVLIPVPAHMFIHQISEFEHIVITVANLTMHHKFYDKTITLKSDDENMTVPLDYGVLYSLAPKDREWLANKAFQLTVTTIKIVKKKWYQRKIFKVFLMGVSVAINIIVPGSGLTLGAIIQSIAVTVVTSYVINLAIDLVVKLAGKLGISPGLVAAIAFATSLAFSASGLGNLNASNVFKADNLMKAFNTSADIFNKSTQFQLTKLNQEMKDFQKYTQDEDARLKAAQALITKVIPPDLELLTAPLHLGNNIYLGETAEEFYTRSSLRDITAIALDPAKYLTASLDRSKLISPYSSPDGYAIEDELLIE